MIRLRPTAARPPFGLLDANQLVVLNERDPVRRFALTFGLAGVVLILHNRPMQIFAAANMLWEFSLAGLKTFIVLYIVQGLDRSTALASAFIATSSVAMPAPKVASTTSSSQ